jgi:peptidoglycan hydrolase-like protein with peptidoglycan-binding domain
MRVRRATHLALTLLVAAGMGVSGATAAARQTAPAKTPTAKPSAKSRHTKSSRKAIPRVRGQKAPEPGRISEIQTALGKDGSYTGKPNGKWDETTVEAMKRFQEAHGLNPSGKLDAKTLQKLGLGSQTAGVAPPTPPVSSSSLDSRVAKSPVHK